MTTSGPPEGCPDHFRTSRRVSLPLSDLPEGVPTTSGPPGGCSDPFLTSWWVS